MKQKLLIFHPALAPYRIDFFNSLCDKYETSIYFQYKEPREQSFDKKLLNDRINFTPHFLKKGLFGGKNFNIDIFKIIKKKKPDIIFISEFNLLGLLVILYRWICFSKFIIVSTCDDNVQISECFSTSKKVIRNFFLNNIDAVIFASSDTRDWYQFKCKGISKYIYFPIIQEETLFRDSLKKAESESSKLYEKYNLLHRTVLLYVGRLAVVKNLSLLLNAYQVLVNINPKCSLLIVGDGDLMESLKEQSYNLGISTSVIFAGKKEGIELMAHYNLGDIFILPSSFEPFGTVINEALLSGCYVFCSSVAGSSCLIKNKINGEVLDMKNPQYVASRINDYLNNNQSFDKKNKMLVSYNECFSNLISEIEKL